MTQKRPSKWNDACIEREISKKAFEGFVGSGACREGIGDSFECPVMFVFWEACFEFVSIKLDTSEVDDIAIEGFACFLFEADI